MWVLGSADPMSKMPLLIDFIVGSLRGVADFIEIDGNVPLIGP